MCTKVKRECNPVYKVKCTCENNSKNHYCFLTTDNTLVFGDNYPHEGGDYLTPSMYHNADDYLEAVDFELNKNQNIEFKSKIIRMLNKNGFKYVPWKIFIKASEDYIWVKEVEMTKEEIENILGYKIKIV